ncbi:MerR family transcriptional regulator [Maribellus sediminis]|uniref:MerR family transcriptional regulator n=1 Tax=Maribellus sediminis TaxID=2696285 RepID=UPI00142F805F|nr:MerR family transcriptional regulator [Maribellus sediminis]
MKESGYSIKDLEVLSGIKMHTIRIWEKRYSLLNPHRTDTNIRWYDDSDLKRLLNISMLTKNGFKISKIAGWDDAELRDKVLKISEDKSSDSDYLERFMLLMVDMNTQGFEDLIDEILQKNDIEEAFFDVFFALFERVGTYWQVGSIFPAQEHFVTNLFRQKLITAIDQLKVDRKRGSTMLFFTHEEELHEMGLLFYSYLAKKRGFDIFYLGQSVPFDDLQKISELKTIDFAFTAFTNSIPKEELENYLVQLKDCFPKQKIFVTGRQIQIHSPALPRNVKSVKDFREFQKFLGTTY